MESQIQQWAARQAAVVARWCGSRRAVVVVLYGEEDWRSVRALVRASGSGCEGRDIAVGLTPTPSLPGAVLAGLSEEPDYSSLVATLGRIGHPLFPALEAVSVRGELDLAGIELSLRRTYSDLALRQACRGDGVLQRVVRDWIDQENATTLVSLAGQPPEREYGELFLPGGWHLAEQDFRELLPLVRRNPKAGFENLYSRLSRSIYRGLDPAGGGAAWQRQVLSARISATRKMARVQPLSTAPIAYHALRLRGVVQDLRQMVWSLGLGRRGTSTSRLVTP